MKDEQKFRVERNPRHSQKLVEDYLKDQGKRPVEERKDSQLVRQF